MANVTQWRRKANGAHRAKVFLLAGVILALAGSMGCKRSSRSINGPERSSTGPADEAVLHLEPFVVNLTDPEENRFLRVGIDLGLEKPLAAKGNEGGAPIARIRDCILCVLSTWRSDALLAMDGKQKLKDEILRALQDRVPELGATEVYFTEFLVQR